MTTIHLIRHGQINSNVTGALDTAVPGPPLNETGLLQAKVLVDTFRGVPIDQMYASTATRAQMTAAPLAEDRGLSVIIRDELREISAGELEMSLLPADRLAYHEATISWAQGSMDVRLGGGTNGHEVLERADHVFNEIAATGAEHVAVVAHGSFIAFWAAVRLSNMRTELFNSHPPVNTGFVTFKHTGSGWNGISWMGATL